MIGVKAYIHIHVPLDRSIDRTRMQAAVTHHIRTYLAAHLPPDSTQQSIGAKAYLHVPIDRSIEPRMRAAVTHHTRTPLLTWRHISPTYSCTMRSSSSTDSCVGVCCWGMGEWEGEWMGGVAVGCDDEALALESN